jgi:hypothetical protein
MRSSALTKMALATQDPAKTSLPLQVSGFVLLIVASIVNHWPTERVGLAIHFIGDVWFFFQIKAAGFLK